MEQEALDERMTNTGSVPVADGVHRLPSAANGESEFAPLSDGHIKSVLNILLTLHSVKGHKAAREEEDEEAELAKLQAEMAMS